jgi:tetratricopeptide (TPR) repeat protein
MCLNYFIILSFFSGLFFNSSTIAAPFNDKKARAEYKKIGDSDSAAFRSLLLKVPVHSSLWFEMASKLGVMTRGKLRKEAVFSISGANHILSEDPFEPLKKIFYSEMKYEPKWDAIPMRSRLYVQNYARINDFNKALHHIENVMQEEPANLYLIFNLVWLLEKTGHYQKAATILRSINGELMDFETRIMQRKWLCRLYFRLNNYPEVEYMLNLLKPMCKRRVDENRIAWEKESDPERKKTRENDYLKARLERAGVLNYLGLVLYIQEKRILAFDLFESIENLFPGSFTYSFNKNKIFLESRKYETTLKNINEIIDNILALASFLGKKVAESLNRGQFLEATDYSQDRDYFYRIYSLLLTRKGEILFREKLYDAAMIVFRESTSRTPQDYVSWYRMGEILFLQQKYTQSLQAFRKVVEHSPKETKIHEEGLKRIDEVFNEEALEAISKQDKFSKMRDEFFQNLSVEQKDELLALKDIIMSGIRFLNEGRHKMVIDYFKRYMKDYPLVVEFPYYLGRAWHEMNHPGLAKLHYQKALELDPEHLPSLVGYFYFICIEHNFTVAENLLKKMERIAPDNHQVLASKGWY